MDYEAKLESFYSRLPLTGGTVIDVGAHVGRHSLPLARLVGREGLVHAFEPIPSIRSTLVENLAQASLNNVIIYPFPLSDTPTGVQFHYIENMPEESGIKARHVYNAPPAPAKLLDLYARRLDDLLPSVEASFVKIDIEGGELDMLTGAIRTLKISRPIVAFECGAGSFLGYHDNPEAIFQIFNSLGFYVYSILGERIINAQMFRQAAHAQTLWDYVAFPAELVDMATLLIDP